MKPFFLLMGGAFLAIAVSACATDSVILTRLPEGGVQPQAVEENSGVVHLIYLKGDPQKADVLYIKSLDGGRTFSKPLRVSEPNKGAMAVGTVRGPHIALGLKGRIHVAWMESPDTMLYTRLNDSGTAFEKPRNVLRNAKGLDGGGSLAADGQGRVYVVWHAGTQENERKVWVAVSTNGGQTFAAEQPAWNQLTGACGCCGMRAFAGEDGALFLSYRSATDGVHRDVYLLQSRDGGQNFKGEKVDTMEGSVCIMSTAYLGRGPRISTGGQMALMGWETAGHIHGATIDPSSGKVLHRIEPPEEGGNSKHVVLVANGTGRLLMAWTEGTAWDQGGKVAWQVFGKGFLPLAGERGRWEGLPAWGSVAAFARPDGGFTIVY